MECNQSQTAVAVTKTLYENFIEEKCECDLLIPDYFPAAEKIIQCCALPVITKKEVEGDRLNLEGVCKFSVIYQGEDESGIKFLSETVSFNESFPLKEASDSSWVQAMMRVSGTSCRLLNPRKISARTLISIALKVKDLHQTETIEAIDCNEAEALFSLKNVYTVLEHVSDTTKVQGEIEVHTDIQDVLKTDGVVCIKDIKVMSGKAMIKGVLDLYVLFTPEDDPCKVEQTSTAIPFSQLLELRTTDEDAMMDASSLIQNLRTDVETDDSGKNRLISITATILTEGEVSANRDRNFLIDAYSNLYRIDPKTESVSMETMVEQGECAESIRYELNLDGTDMKIIQIIGSPIVRKITGQDNTLSIEGILDVSLFICEGEQYRSVDKSFPFTLKKDMKHVGGQMRCEARPCLIGTDYSINGETVEIKAEMQCSVTVFLKETMDVISDLNLDIESPVELPMSSNLIVYFGEKGERLWDIARRYATSVSNIKQINDLSKDVLEEKKLLLISR